MGSWYNLEGEALANCITRKCGMMPILTAMPSPQQRAEYRAKREEWVVCKNKCQGTLTGTSIRVPLGGINTSFGSAPSGNTGTDSDNIMDTRPVQVGASDSVTDSVVPNVPTNMKIGLVVGAAAIIGLWLYFRKK